jgi:hypothetical protein
MKICSKCNKEKDISEFYKRKGRKSGLSSHCKSCIKQFKLENKLVYQTIARNSCKKWRSKNKEDIKSYNKKYKSKHTEDIKIYNKKDKEYRRKFDSNYIIRHRLDSRIRMALINNSKSNNTMKLIGCNIAFIKKYLQFTAILNGYKDFNIENYSTNKYHIDHIVPCAKFNLKCSYHQKLCFNYTNLQILTKDKNLEKRDK